MRVVVDLAICQDHGQCVYAAPEVFALVDGRLEYDAAPADGLLDEVEEAMNICPLQAITIED